MKISNLCVPSVMEICSTRAITVFLSPVQSHLWQFLRFEDKTIKAMNINVTVRFSSYDFFFLDLQSNQII